jgi:hypothetical protein
MYILNIDLCPILPVSESIGEKLCFLEKNKIKKNSIN